MVVYGDKVANIIITFQTTNPVFDVSFTEDSRAGLGGWLKVDTEKLDMNSEFANAESIEYIWVKDGEYIPGATGSSYKIKPEDANSNIYVLIKTEWNGANYYGVSDAKSVSHKVCVVYIDYDPIEGDCYIPYNSHKLFSVTDPELGSVVAVDWKDGSMVDMAEGDLLEEGAVYNLFIIYQLNEGFVWANDIAFCFNGGELVSSDYADPTNLIIAKLLEITAAEHTHTYEKEIYGIDDDGHWLRCDNEYCANRDEDCYQYVDHVSNDATCQTPGTCAVCGKDGIEGKHIYNGGEYVKTSEEYHEVKCLYCDETDGMENAHFGGTATCKSAKICEGCNSAYGELDPENHTGVEEWTKTENTHIKKYSCCDLVTVPESEHNIVSGECTVCGYGCTHTSATKQIGKAPECELDGWKDYYKCDKCGDFFTDESCESKIADIEQWKIGDGKLGKISHAWGSWTSNGDDSHTRICTNNNNHTETNDCSGGEATCTERAACTVCGEKYGNTAPHSYTTENGYKGDDGHANTCVCGAHDTPTAHTPDRQEPTEDDPKKCTVCGYIIEPAAGHISHNPKDEWQSDSTHHWHGCTGCEGQQLDKAEHNPQEDDGDCTTPVLCVDCGRVVIEAKTHAFTNDCDKDCNNLGCENTRTTAHIPAEDDGDCTTDILCTVCGEIAVKGSDDHISGADDGDCTTEILCTVCGKVTVEAKDAHTPEADDGNCITAIKCTVCTTIITAAKGAHVDTDSNGKCDACGSTVEVPSPDPDPKEPKEGLSGGAIAGIVIGSVTTAGIGGFALVWFVIKKKSFADLIGIFKK